MQRPLGVHWLFWSQVRPPGHVPQSPPQPSSPQALPLQSGVQVVFPGEHWPLLSQVSPLAQAPQLPPQPSSPHTLPVHFGVQPPP